MRGVLVKVTITCTRCFFSFSVDGTRKRHVCPACGVSVVLTDNIDDLELRRCFQEEAVTKTAGSLPNVLT